MSSAPVPASPDPSDEPQGAPPENFISKSLPEASRKPPEGDAGNPDNTEDAMRPPRSAWNDDFEPIAQPAGENIPGVFTVVEKWWEQKIRSNVIVIAGDHHDVTQWAAETFVQNWRSDNSGRGDFRRSTSTKIKGYQCRPLIGEQLINTPARYAVIDAWEWPLSIAYWNRLSDAAQQFHKQTFGLIFWTRQASVAEHDKDWPADNIELLRLAFSEPESSADAGFDPSIFARLFGQGLISLEEILLSQREIVEQALVRILVLFGDLSEGDLEEVILAVLGDREIPLKLSPDSAEQKIRFADLWHQGKASFMQKCGVVWRADENRQRIGFQSEEIRAKACEAAWRDTPAMIRVFAAIEERSILFADESGRHRRALYESYIAAAAALACREPVHYGDRWLDAICDQYIQWVKRVVPEIDFSEHGDILSVLKAIEQNQKYFTKLWRRFAQRMGFLCRNLSEHSLSIVEDFFRRLESKGLHQVLWMLVLELKNTALDFSRWTAHIINSHQPTGKIALGQMARDSIFQPAAGQNYHALLAPHLAGDAVSGKPIHTAAIAFPARILSCWFQRLEKDNPPQQSLDAFLALPLAGFSDTDTPPPFLTVRDYWAACFCSPEFEAAAERWDEDETESDAPEGFALAFALFQGAVLAIPRATAILQIANDVRRADARRWQQMRPHWKGIAELLTGRLRRLPQGDEHQDQRLRLNSWIDACAQLNGL